METLILRVFRGLGLKIWVYGNGTDKLFIDSFNGFGFDQCISGSTNNKGGTLDLMLTNSKNFVKEINVSPDSYLCKSDYYFLTLEVKSNVKHNKVPKKKNLNFIKANWEVLNNELGNIHWDAISDSRLYGTGACLDSL